MRLRFMMIIGVLLWLTACGGQETPTAVTTPDVSQIAQPTTAAAAPATAVADATLPPPPTVAPAPTTAPAATEEAQPLITAEDFGDNINPLTGETVSDTAVLQRRPLAIKISNAPPNFVRPQAGLNDADLVFEHTAEGSITRFTAIFYDSTPERVGPIRSARLIDLELPAMYDAALAYSGASAGVIDRLNNADFRPRIIGQGEIGYFRTGDETKPFEHTLYGNPFGFWQALDAKGENHAPNFQTFNAFSNEMPAGGTAASYASVNYQWELVEWRYDAANGRYWRWAAGEPILDANTGEQVSAANVVIIAPFHAEDPTICEEIRDGVCAHLSVQIQIWGSGSGIILRDGQQFAVNWHREGRNDMLTFTDADGRPFPLKIGNSWVQLVPTWYSDPVTVTP